MRIEACWECGKNEEVHYHHVVPRSKGGTRTLPLCLECHGKVHNKKMHSSELVKASYARRRKQNPDAKFGSSRERLDVLRKQAGEVISSKAVECEAKVLFWEHSLAGLGYKTYQQKAERLNELGLYTRNDCAWTAPALCRAIKRAKRRTPPVTPSEG